MEVNITINIQELGWRYEPNWSGSEQGQVGGSCVEGNDLLGSTKRRIFWLAEYLVDSQEAICYVQLVTV